MQVEPESETEEVQPFVLTKDNDPRIKSAASWLFWIAALSALNLILVKLNSHWGFGLSMGLSDVFGAVSVQAKSGLVAFITFSIAMFVIAVMGILGFFAYKGKAWAFIVGMILLLLDTALLLLDFPQTILSVGIHAWAAYSLLTGYTLVSHYEKLAKSG
jgi:hypothetical protein